MTMTGLLIFSGHGRCPLLCFEFLGVGRYGIPTGRRRRRGLRPLSKGLSWTRESLCLLLNQPSQTADT
eukprot:scaffold10541_cov99-Skeletonema_dohrnii-CCMP3373.AAC.2